MEAEKLPFFVANAPLSQQLTARRLNAIISCIRANSIRPGVGYLYNRSVGGTSLTVKAGGGGGGTTDAPFKLSNATVGTTLKVKIKFGMVNTITPGGMGDPEDPDLTLTFSGTDSKYVVLDVETDVDGIATTATITLETTVPDATETHGYIALGLVTYTAATVGPPATDAYITCNQSVAGSLWHQQCGATTHLFGSV